MTDTLPRAEWTQREDLSALVSALGQGNARYVGGAVRDTLLGLESNDIDIATPLTPDDVILRLESANIRVIPTGIAHGTVTAILKTGSVEITSLRSDISTDGRRATVAYTTNWELDACRRDFTINALYADPHTGQVYDYHDGINDLKHGCVKFIGDPYARIREDHLRILRYFRFKARFGSQETDVQSENACAELASTLQALSRERICMEILGILGVPDPGPTIHKMIELGVLPVILPKASAKTLDTLIISEHQQGIAPDPIRRLAALFAADPSLAEKIGSRLRLSTAQRKRLISAMARKDKETLEQSPKALAYRIGVPWAMDRLLLAGADVSAIQSWVVPIFPLRGGEIIAKGIKAGPQIAQLLRKVEEQWVAEDFPSQSRVSQILENELRSRSDYPAENP